MKNSSENEHGLGQIVENILQQAILVGASDIHIEPERGLLTVRFRIDGILYPLTGVDKFNPEEVISKIKIMAQMDIMERRLPLDGHLEFIHDDKKYNFRVSTTPTIYGEAVVMRVLNREGMSTSLEDLGFSPEQMEIITKIIYSPYGIALITGPTGSGKTTLMYSFLGTLNKPERNILTLEDPVEFQMQNIRQMQTNETIGWDFAKGMRALVRQDPDVIMLGEIRDPETASMAFQAALVGRLVFSTFHTFDVQGIIIRLIEMGIPRSVVAHALMGVISARLVRKICSSCVVDYESTEKELQLLGIENKKYHFKKGNGCEACHGTGYSGRIGIFEIVHFDDEIKANIMQDKAAMPLHELLKSKIGTTLRQSAIQRVIDGSTTVDEAVRVLGVN